MSGAVPRAHALPFHWRTPRLPTAHTSFAEPHTPASGNGNAPLAKVVSPDHTLPFHRSAVIEVKSPPTTQTLSCETPQTPCNGTVAPLDTELHVLPFQC